MSVFQPDIIFLMDIFFDDINKLDQFTKNLKLHQAQLICPTCKKSDQFISHGFVYKQQVKGKLLTVGKRIFCTNRYRKTGCGSTTRFYIKQRIPSFQYSCAHLVVFVCQLLKQNSIQVAYQQATGKYEHRNAYRWLSKLTLKMSEHRAFLYANTAAISLGLTHFSERFKLLLSPLSEIFDLLTPCPCSQYQMLVQQSVL